MYNYFSFIAGEYGMAFYLSYVVLRDEISSNRLFGNKKFFSPLGHSCIAITETTPNLPPKILFRIGFIGTSQVVLEDFMTKVPGRRFYHKTFPISESELADLLVRINQDRKLNRLTSKKGIAEPVKEGLESKPSGPQFSWFTYNCKSHAKSLLKEVGIEDDSIQNSLIDIPCTDIDKLEELNFRPVGKSGELEWTVPFVVSTRSDYSQFSDEENEALYFDRSRAGYK